MLFGNTVLILLEVLVFQEKLEIIFVWKKSLTGRNIFSTLDKVYITRFRRDTFLYVTCSLDLHVFNVYIVSREGSTFPSGSCAINISEKIVLMQSYRNLKSDRILARNLEREIKELYYYACIVAFPAKKIVRKKRK